MNQHEQSQIMYDLIKEKIKELDEKVNELSKKSRDLMHIKAEMAKANSDLV